MTSTLLGFLIVLHGFAGQLITGQARITGQAKSAGGEVASASITFTTDSARVAELRGYRGSLFPRAAPFGLEDSQVLDTGSTLAEPYGTVPGANGELVAPRDDSIPEDEDTTCDFCPSS